MRSHEGQNQDRAEKELNQNRDKAEAMKGQSRDNAGIKRRVSASPLPLMIYRHH
jgi:hypothetical protein